METGARPGDGVTAVTGPSWRIRLGLAAPEHPARRSMSPSIPSGLTSIIVPCCNQVEFTRLCVQALFRHTRPPWELIVVDNGSTDGTGDYLAGVRDAAPCRSRSSRMRRTAGSPRRSTRAWSWRGASTSCCSIMTRSSPTAGSISSSRWARCVAETDVEATYANGEGSLTTKDSKEGVNGQSDSPGGRPADRGSSRAAAHHRPGRADVQLRAAAAAGRGRALSRPGRDARLRPPMARRAPRPVVHRRQALGLLRADEAGRVRRPSAGWMSGSDWGCSMTTTWPSGPGGRGSRWPSPMTCSSTTSAAGPSWGTGSMPSGLLEENARRFAEKWGHDRPRGRRVALEAWPGLPGFLEDVQRRFARGSRERSGARVARRARLAADGARQRQPDGDRARRGDEPAALPGVGARDLRRDRRRGHRQRGPHPRGRPRASGRRCSSSPGSMTSPRRGTRRFGTRPAIMPSGWMPTM